jgi:UDP-4-amino-4,6-dideoxy-N-acetyl-beta-L-altrosamine transaminase
MIPYGRHSIAQKDIDAVIQVLRSDWLTCGPVVDKFEDILAKVVGAKYTVACSNGTTALHLAMLALGIGSADVVLVPAITFLASANAARYVGANVVFVDIEPSTGLMTAETLEKAILTHKSKSLKAVVNVHLAGQCEDLEAIYNVAKKHNLLIIEDAAHAIGTVYTDQNNNRHPIGSNAFSDITTFSFHPVKTIAMGEGGAVTTNNFEIAKKLKLLRSHGMVREQSEWEGDGTGPWYYEMQELGYNYRVSDINCALGISQLEKLDAFKMKRTEIVKFYDDALVNSEHIKPVKKLNHSDTAWHLYIVNIDYEQIGKSRSQVMIELKENDISTQVHYIPLYKQPYYKKTFGDIILPGAELYYSKCLSLPLYMGIQNKQINYIIGVINSCIYR